jgi:hypothetical protein
MPGNTSGVAASGATAGVSGMSGSMTESSLGLVPRRRPDIRRRQAPVAERHGPDKRGRSLKRLGPSRPESRLEAVQIPRCIMSILAQSGR